MSETTYIKGAFLKKSGYGIKMSGKADDLIAEIKKHTNAKGYYNFEIKEKKEPGTYGDTHYLILDTYRPKADNNDKSDSPF